MSMRKFCKKVVNWMRLVRMASMTANVRCGCEHMGSIRVSFRKLITHLSRN